MDRPDGTQVERCYNDCFLSIHFRGADQVFVLPRAGHAGNTLAEGGTLRRRHHPMDARHWRKLVTAAEAETAAVLRSLPDGLRERAARLPLVFEPWPGEALVATGLDPDILGLFVGDAHNVSDSIEPMPPQIFLFLESIWEFAEADEDAFREEVRVTYLHELGHFLGLDEDDMEVRGLD